MGKPAQGGGGSGRRRLGGWGFEHVQFAPPAPMLAWLERRIGKGEPFPRVAKERSLGAYAADLATADLATADLATADLAELSAPVSVDPEDRLRHARGQGLADILRLRAGAVERLPAAVARPRTDREVEAVLAEASRRGWRVIPWGGGTSVTGGVNTLDDPRPALVVDLEYLSGLLHLDAESGLATLGAGTTGPALEAQLGARGFTLGHFPQSFELSTLGGWIATHSSGQESLGYGRIADRVAGLDLVAPTGRLEIPALPASAAGPDLRHFVTGSEGRFGIITRAVMRVRQKPEELRVEAALAPSWEAGVAAARALVQEGIPLGLLRLSDEPETEVAMTVGLARSRFQLAVRAYLRLRGVGRGCLLLLGASGGRKEVGQTLDRARSPLREHGVVGLGAGPGRHWHRDRFRHPYLRDALLDQGYATETFETAVPWSAVERVYARVRRALAGLPVLCHLSHPYEDGVSLYFTFFFPCPQDLDEAIATWAAHKRTAQNALADEGAATSHHHGIGSWHGPWAAREWGPTGVRMLGAVARELDPEGMMNPHVLLDPMDRLER